MEEINEFEEGSVIGNYRIVRPLGQGGMGTVYEVEHLELGTHYALKTFTFDPNHHASHALKKKFLEEGRLLARLKHPNLTHVFDLGFEEGTQMPYFVMDLVTYEDGDTYTVEDIDLSDIDEDMVYGWFKQLASALDYIHGEGIVHRDIKPSNLLVDKDLNIILTDFGISRIFGAKIKSEVEATRTVVTKTGRGKLALGTEKYIAPEVSNGEETTPQADSYSLGVMLLRWLTGFYYCDNPGAIALLSRKKLNWLPVISQLVAPFGRRPEKYSELVKQLKPVAPKASAQKPAASKASAQKPVEKSHVNGRNTASVVMKLLVAAGLCAGGCFAWRYIKANEKSQQAQIEAIQRQMEAKEKAEAERKAEEKRLADEQAKKKAEEKRLAEEKRKAREAKLAEERRIEASRIKIEKQKANELTVAKVPDIQEREEPKEEKREFKVVEKLSDVAEEKKDYGPIPDRKYNWLKGDNAKNPLKVDFELANGAKMELMPIKAGMFYMANQDKQGQSHHKVVLTYPFWMSKFKVTANQWREFAPNDCEDCRAIEAAVGSDYPVSKNFSRKSVLAYCQYLTEKYRAQLPKDYVFRLPSEAEWERAMDVEKTRQQYLKFEVPEKRHWLDSISTSGKDAKAKWEELLKAKRLNDIFEWSNDSGQPGWGRGVFVGGKQSPMASGVYDMWQNSREIGLASMLLDTYEKGSSIEYSAVEEDPLHWYIGEKETCQLRRKYSFVNLERWLLNFNDNGTFHLVLGPDLIKQKAWEKGRTPWDAAESPKASALRLKLDPKKIPSKISKAKEAKFRMVCGEEMVLCAVPAVKKFNMSNVEGQEKQVHSVTLTKPFWMSKYPITIAQWREFGPYDEDINAQKLEKAFPKLKICQTFNYWRWSAFCKFLTERYKNILPDGYVFRLPTEAEWEWALVADDKAYAKDIRVVYIEKAQRKYLDAFDKNKYLEKIGLKKNEGWCGRLFVAGRTEPNRFGICDLLHIWEEYVFDIYAADPLDHPYSGRPEKNVFYKDDAVDPVHWDGVLSDRILRRGSSGGLGRVLRRYNDNALVHIVVAPDIETGLRKKELSDYPIEDFGGRFIGDKSKVYKVSSSNGGEKGNMGTENALKRMLTRENVRIPFVEGKDQTCGWQSTRPEDAPWIQLELEKKMQITGIHLECYNTHGCSSRQMRVWVSDDGIHEREVYEDERGIRLFRVDLRKKNIKAKYIRIGREPGINSEHFRINKVLIYGK